MKQLKNKIAIILDKASIKSTAVDQLTKKYPISILDAYEIQKELIKRRCGRGSKLSGYKLGFTSSAKMEQMGVHDLIWGRLTNDMEITNQNVMQRKKFIHPRVEPEIAFLVGKKVDRILNRDNVFDYIDKVAPAIEIIDSRYKNFKFSLEDVIADNCSSSGYVLGNWFSNNTPIQDLNLTLKVNNKIVERGNTDAILGDPLESFIEASRLSHQYNFKLDKGMILLAGAATTATFVAKGDVVKVEFDVLGNVKLNVN